jgi:hypothetical protein
MEAIGPCQELKPGSPARSPSLYRLRNPDSQTEMCGQFKSSRLTPTQRICYYPVVKRLDESNEYSNSRQFWIKYETWQMLEGTRLTVHLPDITVTFIDRVLYTTVTHKSIGRQIPQHTHGQQYWSSVSFVSANFAHAWWRHTTDVNNNVMCFLWRVSEPRLYKVTRLKEHSIKIMGIQFNCSYETATGISYLKKN